MYQDIIAVIKDAFLEHNQATITELGLELSKFINANSVGIDRYGVFAEFKYEEHSFRLRYIAAERSFWIAEYLTTQEFYELVMKENPSNFLNSLSPAHNIEYNSAIEFCEKLNNYFKFKDTNFKFGLPSSKQWFAAQPYNYEFFNIENKYDEYLKQVAWFNENSNGSTQPVGLKQCNINGVYDLLGNVWEWTTDLSNEDSIFKDTSQVILGGSWCSYNYQLFSYMKATFRSSFNLGFRIFLNYF